MEKDIKENQINKNNEYSIYDYSMILLQFRKIIAIFCGFVFIFTTILVFFIMDPIYLSTGSVKSTTKSSGLSGVLSTGGLSDLADYADLGGGAGAKELALYEQIITSRRCLEETIIKFNLLNELNIDYMEEAVKFFRDNILYIQKDKLAGTLTIGTYYKDKQKAKDITDFLIYQLNKINVELNVQNARNQREFIEGRYNTILNDLKKAEDSLKTYQEHNGLAPDVVGVEVTKADIELESQIKSEEIKLELLKKILTPEQTEVKNQEEKINLLQKQLNDIRNSVNNNGYLNLKGAPSKIMDFFRLKRTVEIQNKILTYIIPIFEQVKIDEKKETPTLILIDNPNLPEKKVKPKRVITIFVSTLASFVLISLLVILYSRIKNSFLKNKSYSI